jgi:hypothetical protein
MSKKEIRETLMGIVTDAVDSAMIEYDKDNNVEIDDYTASETSRCIEEMLIQLVNPN